VNQTTPTAPAQGSSDPLSDVLRTVRLTGSLFFRVDATSPWCVDVPEARCFAETILPGTRHVISYHVVVEGRGFARVPGLEPVAFEQGDVIVFPHADAYRMESAVGVEPEFDREQMLAFFRGMAAGALPFTVPEGGGEAPPAKFVCGFLGCDARPFNPLLAHLPRLLRVKARKDEGDMLDKLVQMTLAEAQSARAGAQSVRLRLSELLFVEVLRRHLDVLPAEQTGWFRGLADPVVGRALALLHGSPAHAWTLAGLAEASGASRSVLAERFTRLVGQSPLQYLAHWRVQIAASMLTETRAKVSAVAADVGYSSEAAFSRAFRKIAGVPPSQWRNGGHQSP
jgi:AraC-like DNA-binding protein